MIKTLMHHRVKDFSNWKKAFDNFSPTRKLKGEISYEVGRSHEDPNDVYVINEWRSVKDFNSFYQNVSILGADSELEKVFRVALSKTVGQTIKNAFNILGIDVPERM